MFKSTKLENPIEMDLKDCHEPLFFWTCENGGYGTHEVLLSHSAYTLAKMWEDGFKWSENMWCEVSAGETEKAVLVSVCACLYWIPKRLIKKVRRIRIVEEVK